MTCRIDKKGWEREQKVAEVVEGKNSEKYKSYAEVACILGVPESSVYARASGYQTRTQADEHEQLLSEEEEKELTRWIHQLTDSAYLPKPYAVREMAEAICTRHIIGVNDASIRRVRYEDIDEQWVKRFMNRHPELESLISEQIKAARIQEISRPILEKWFADVQSIINEYDIWPRNIYNMDETGFSIGFIKATRVIVDRTSNIRYATYPGRQE
jgi:rubrerythrin